MNPAMRGRGSNNGHGGDSGNWREEVRLKIHQEAQGIHESIPPYFRRFDAIENEDHPSIFKRRHKTNHVAAISAHPLPATNPTAPPPLQLAGSAANGCGVPQDACSCRETGGQLPATRSTAIDCEIIVVAVGPYHQDRPACTWPLITRAKKCGIVKFLSHPRFGLDIADFLGWARENEARARGCYERDSITMDSEKLAEMLLLDGCVLLFAVFLLRASVCEDQRPADLARDTMHGTEFIYLSADISLHMKQTRLDLLMLDNQIPFFVLEELHNRLKGTLFRNIKHSAQELSLSCFDDVHPSGFKLGQVHRSGHLRFPARIHHLLHLFHSSRVPRGRHKVDTTSILPKEPGSHLPSATELRESLTSFKKAPSGSYSLDIAFQSTMLGMRGVMSIPALRIDDNSECLFRNLIALEQNHLQCGLGVTAYSICMAQLLQSEADAKVLRKKGILVHTQKTDKEIVDFFRDLRDEYGNTLMPEDLLNLCKDVAAHQQSRAGRVVKGVGRQCFPRQTVTFFVIFGAIISIATLINTVHSMYRYYHPSKGSTSFYYPPKPSP